MPISGDPSRALALRIHGGIASEELALLGLHANDIIDFSSSTNPYGPCRAVVEAVQSARIDRYPDSTASTLRKALAATCDTAPDRIVVGNGAADLLWTLARVLIRPGTPVLIAEPTFAEFTAAACFAEARIMAWRARRDAQFALDMGAIEQLVSAHGAKVVYICSPTTPTGARVPVEGVAALAARNPNVTIVLDQAFVSLSDNPEDHRIPVPENVVRVRSLTKEHAIAGLRLGYLLASPTLALRIEAARPAWTTNAVAQAAGLTALGEPGFVEESRQKLLADRDDLDAGLRRIGIVPVRSSACFFVFPVEDSALLRRLLLKRKLLVRDCSSFGMPGFVRVGARPKADRERLLAALRQEFGPC